MTCCSWLSLMTRETTAFDSGPRSMGGLFDWYGWNSRRSCGAAGHRAFQLKLAARREDDGALDDILEFAHVARPSVTPRPLELLARHLLDALSHHHLKTLN